jgi:hypothetical protein
MAAFTKFQQFAYDLSTKVHNLNADALKVMLSNTAPNAATGQVKADITEIGAGNGYTAGGAAATNSGAGSGGTYTITGTAVVFTASGGTIGPFRYVVLYNNTPTSPAKPLVGYWDYGSAITLQDGDTFTVQFNGATPTGTILTVA